MRTINVEGESQLFVKPTMMRLSITISGDRESFEEAVYQSTKETERFKYIVERLGFSKHDLKTIRLDIDTNTESYRDKNNNYRQRFVGYSYVHCMFLEFAEDNKRLGEILSALLESRIEFEFQVSHTISPAEQQDCQNKLLSDAVLDAKKKAEILAKASGVTLGEVVTIKHGNDCYDSYSNNFLDSECRFSPIMESAPVEFSVDAKEIELTNRVHMVWEIK